MGCRGFAPSPGRRLRAALAQSPRVLSAAAPPPPPPAPGPARRQRQLCCRAQGVLGHWGAAATFGHVPDGGLRTLRKGSAEEHGAAPESDRMFCHLSLRGSKALLTGAVAIPYGEGLSAGSNIHHPSRGGRRSIGRERERRGGGGENGKGLPVGG